MTSSANSARAQLGGFVDLTRPANALAAGGLTFTGSFVATGVDAPVRITAAIIVTVLATAGGNAINDYFDRAVDAINRPQRPIPRGAVTPSQTAIFSALLLSAATVTASILPPLALIIAVSNLIALVLYTNIFKTRPVVGNLIVASLTGSTFLFGAAAVYAADVKTVWMLAVLAGLATFAREIAKDVEDRVGDKTQGLQTLPIMIGDTYALHVATGALVVAVLASSGPMLTGGYGISYLLLVAPADLIMLRGMKRAYQNPASAQRRLKQGMFLAMGAFIVGQAVSLGPTLFASTIAI
ncbi:MAG: UbiA prenyltransferase [Haloquadratum sp. J07HQX50]|jgi:geranylgeranylglycerol-phosphate geranylgeranyltransferase (EC 2.5.1.42)|nr:MAG: UbiA prenyltransferase [Haloquadratum sp. J07HQX50]